MFILRQHPKSTNTIANGDEVIALTRELGVLPRLLKIRNKSPLLRVLYESHDYFRLCAFTQARL